MLDVTTANLADGCLRRACRCWRRPRPSARSSQLEWSQYLAGGTRTFREHLARLGGAVEV